MNFLNPGRSWDDMGAIRLAVVSLVTHCRLEAVFAGIEGLKNPLRKQESSVMGGYSLFMSLTRSAHTFQHLPILSLECDHQ